jgi:hypothetical protein
LGRDAPLVQFDTVLGDTDAIFAMSLAFNPPLAFSSFKILPIGVCIFRPPARYLPTL